MHTRAPSRMVSVVTGGDWAGWDLTEARVIGAILGERRGRVWVLERIPPGTGALVAA